jgi:molybdate transport system ATP-binding protein
LRELALPTILVTHDFEDAVALADHVGVIVDGKLRQFGTSSELVDRPTDAFVASFTGANLLRGNARRLDNDMTLVHLESGELVYSSEWREGEVGVVVYPWEVSVGRLHQEDSAMNLIEGEIRSVVRVGNRVRVRIGPITAEVTCVLRRQARARAGRLGVRNIQGDRDPARPVSPTGRLVLVG